MTIYHSSICSLCSSMENMMLIIFYFVNTDHLLGNNVCLVEIIVPLIEQNITLSVISE